MNYDSCPRALTLFFWCVGLLAFQAEIGLAADFTVAIFYGDPAPLDELKAFDVVVVEPDHDYDPNGYRTSNSELFAYVSIGEFTSIRGYAKAIPENWVLGKNDDWDARVVDQKQEAWPKFVTDKIIGPLWEEGYRGFFLDTLDSYHLVAKTAEQRKQQEQGLVQVIQAIKTKYPDAKLIFNRGFEIIPSVAKHVYAVAAESLFRGWDQGKKRYVEVPAEDRQWLLAQLQDIQKSQNLPIIAIDYLPAQDREHAKRIAQKIQHLDMIPWVSTPELDVLGIGAIEVIPRKVFSIFNGARDPMPGHSDLHRFIDLPVNHLGYVPEHWDIRNPLPDYPLIGRYAGVVVWVSGEQHSWSQKLHEWLVKQIQQGVRVALFDSFGFPLQEQNLIPFGLEVGSPRDSVSQVKFSIKDARMGFEIQPIPKRRGFVPLSISTAVEGQSLLQLETDEEDHQDVVAIMPWGGYALFPYAVIQLPDLEHSRWVFDPIEFLQEALRLEPMPIPDTTTQNGRRLLLIHVDGDGFASLAEFPGKVYAGEVLHQDVLRKYQIPTTVSIIEGEIGANGLYPQLSRRLEKAARSMFALPHVELASHSFSHPFFWRDFISAGPGNPGKYNLNVPGYNYGSESF
ncbi:MAG: endo alpha-1,4 polygalactosaminidase, partial [Nitrospirales bacterium]